MVAAKKLECMCCGETKTTKEFYVSKSYIYKARGKTAICKSCIEEVYNKYYKKYEDEKLAIYYMCRKIDCCFSLGTFNGAYAQFKKKTNTTPMWQIYMTKINSLGTKNGAGNEFDNSDELDINAKIEEKQYEGVDPDILDFWGKGYEKEDYEFFENEFGNLIGRYECDSYAQETLFQEIAFTKWDIRKKRRNGDNVDKEITSLQNLMGSANIKPTQENASVNSDQVTFGTLVKKYENEKPIPEPEKDWISKDWIGKYVRVWFLGCLCRMMGKKISFQEEFDEEMSKYTVKPHEDDEE